MAGTSSRDAANSTEIFRKDHPIILACNRHQALILPIRIKAKPADDTKYAAGTVMAKNSVDGFFYAYNDAGASGLNVAKCILLHDVFPAVLNTDMGDAAFGGVVWYDKLVGIDAAGITDLGGRRIVDSSGLGELLKF